MATIKEVAKMAGVSTATVSKYLHGVQLKESNQRAVEMAIKELDYRINPAAQGLRTGKSMTVGILIPELDNLFATSIISIIENMLITRGYSTIICDFKSDRKLEIEKLKFLENRKVDGIVVMPYHLTNEDLLDVDIPIVFIDRVIEDVDRDSVIIDNRESTYKSVKHLVKNGHTNIGILLGPKSIYTSKERYRGYREALEDLGVTIKSIYVKNGSYDITSGHEMVKELVGLQTPPTAILATNYELTIGAIIGLNELNINIPDDISFIGFDNLEMAKIVKPRMTVVTQPIEQIGTEIASILLERMEGKPGGYKTVTLKTELVIQESVRNIK